MIKLNILLSGLLVFTLFGLLLWSCDSQKVDNVNVKQETPLRNKIALNAFSFNQLLRKDSIDLFELMDFAAKLHFDGVDLTGYYFPGYPAAPSDKYIYSIKKKGFDLGLDICGTGVKNDYCNADPEVRKESEELIKRWILVAQKLGAPAIRVFQGPAVSEDHSWDQMAEWAAEVILDCAEFGKEHGVVLEIQNHNNFLKTAEDVHRFMKLVDHEWVGLMLDVGSYRTADPYNDIAETIQYAISWQLKENVFVGGERTPIDLNKIKQIIAKSTYKGYLPIETLGAGDPFVKVERYYGKVVNALK